MLLNTLIDSVSWRRQQLQCYSAILLTCKYMDREASGILAHLDISSRSGGPGFSANMDDTTPPPEGMQDVPLLVVDRDGKQEALDRAKLEKLVGSTSMREA